LRAAFVDGAGEAARAHSCLCGHGDGYSEQQAGIQ
jgi:hypothetical protein